MDPAVQRRIDSDLRELDRAREALRGMRRAAVEQQAVAARVGGHTVRTSDRTRQSELYTRAYDCAQRREKTKPRKKKGKKGKKKKKKKKKHKSSSGSSSSASGSDLSSGEFFGKPGERTLLRLCSWRGALRALCPRSSFVRCRR